jgi:hypothetical protein
MRSFGGSSNTDVFHAGHQVADLADAQGPAFDRLGRDDDIGYQHPLVTVVAWTNSYGDKNTRVFSTTLGHNNATVADDRYMQLITRGMLWACDKLNDDYLKKYDASAAKPADANAGPQPTPAKQ